MPQMMPMLWSFMINSTIMILFLTIIFMHFLKLPMMSPHYPNQKSLNYFQWNWLW